MEIWSGNKNRAAHPKCEQELFDTYFISLKGEEICVKRKEVESQKNA